MITRQIEDLVAANDLSAAIELLTNSTERQSALVLASRLKSLSQQLLNGRLATSEVNQELNNIRISILQLADELRVNGIQANVEPQNYNNNKVDILYEQNRFSEAIVEFKKMLQHRPEDIDVIYKLGRCYLMLKIYQLALETFSSGLKYDSKSGKMLNGMGVTYYNLENFEGALFYYGQALLSEPTNQMFFNNKFTLLIKQGKFDELLQFCSFYIECYPKDAYYYYKRGIVYELHLKNYEKALSDYNSALSLESDNPEFYYQRGSVYSILNRLDESIHDLDQAISLSPDIYYLKMKAAIFHDYNHLEKAISEYNKILKLEPDNSDLHLCRSQAYTTLGFIDAALKDVNKSIEIAPYKAESYYRRAILYREKKNVEYALMDINMAISLAPSDVTFKNFKTSLSTGYKA